MSADKNASIEQNFASISLNDIPHTTSESCNKNEKAEMYSEQSKPKKKIIHFADGSTLEAEDEDDIQNENANDDLDAEKPITKSVASSSTSVPSVDPSSMNWPDWMRHQGSRAGSKTLSVLEGMGGSAAYYLGITTPKYQSEIDEYNRMMTKQKTHEEEMVAWSTGPQTEQPPVVEEVKKTENGNSMSISEK